MDQRKKAEAAIETILIRRVMERKLQGFQREAAEEILEAVTEALDWNPKDQENDCDGT
jgi:hypothetical protein